MVDLNPATRSVSADAVRGPGLGIIVVQLRFKVLWGTPLRGRILMESSLPVASLLDSHPGDPSEVRRKEAVRPLSWKNPEPRPRYDLVVLGAGAAGLVAARGAAAIGAQVALVERQLIGGDCLNTACVPSKTLLRSAHLMSELRRAAGFGAEPFEHVKADFPKIMARLRSVRATLAQGDAVRRLVEEGIDVYIGEGRFLGPDSLEVEGKTLRFKRAIVATGARPALPTEIPGLAEAGFLTNLHVFDLAQLPRRLLVLGGGPVGCELAQAFRRFGSEVTIIHRKPLFLPKEERDAATVLGTAFSREGVEVRLDTTVTSVRRSAEGLLVHLKTPDRSETVACDVILAGVGRVPLIKGLGLESAGVEFDAEKGIGVDDFLKTSNPRIYAAGDACLESKFTHAADASARIAVRNALFLGRQRRSRLLIPWCTYTDPEIAHVGLHVRQAQEQGIDIRTISVPMHEVDRAVIDGSADGFLKVHLAGKSDRILGATIVGRNACEVISQFTIAIEKGIGLASLGGVVRVYPTYSGAVVQAANAYQRTRLTPTVRRLAQWWLRRIR